MDIRNQPTVAGTWSTTHIDVGVRYHFSDPTESVIPYILTAATRRSASVKDLPVTTTLPSDRIDLSGYAWTVGGGVMLYPMPLFSFNVEALLSWGSYSKASLDGSDVDAFDALGSQSTRLKFGVLFWL